MDRLTVTTLLHQMGRRLLLALVLLATALPDAMAREYTSEDSADGYTRDTGISELMFNITLDDGSEAYACDITFSGGSFRSSKALKGGNRNFKFKAAGSDGYMYMHVKTHKGYVIKEIYAYDQVKGSTFSLMEDDGYVLQGQNYFTGKGDGFGVYLRDNGSAMNAIDLRVKDDMEFAKLKLTFQRENPVKVVNSSVVVNCLRTASFSFSKPPSDYAGTITYSTSDASIAAVSNGVIRGIKTGTATISAFFPSYGDYGQKRISVTVDVSRNGLSPQFENSEKNWLSSEPNKGNALLNVPTDYDGKVTYSIENDADSHFSIADQTTGQLAMAPMESGWSQCQVKATFTGSDYFEDASCSYQARVYVADAEGYIKISNYNDFAYYRDLDFAQDKKLRLYGDINITDGYKQWSKRFMGELDGASHTINFRNVLVSDAFFSKVDNANFHDLKFTGQITINNLSNGEAGAALIGEVVGVTQLSRCQSDVALYPDNADIQMCGALVAYVPSGQTLNVSDCRVGTMIVPTANASADCKYAAFVGKLDGALTLNNSLFCGDVSLIPDMVLANGANSNITGENNYMLYENDDAHYRRLRSGDVACQLQGDRDEMVWGQTLAPLDGTEVDADNAPVLTTDAAKRVYKLTPAVAPDAAMVYSNVLEPLLPIGVSSAGYATFYNSFAMGLPTGLKAYTVSIADGRLTLSEIADGVVPAMTAVLLESVDGADFTGRMQMLPADTHQPIGGTDNLLRGSDEETKTHTDNGVCDEQATPDDGSTLYYKLAYGRSGTASATQLGFWWGKAQGASFLSAAHKAWLAVPTLAQPSPSKGFAIADGGAATGIDSPTTQPAHTPIYTLGGQRLSEPLVHRGVYIVNGKKVMMGK